MLRLRTGRSTGGAWMGERHASGVAYGGPAALSPRRQGRALGVSGEFGIDGGVQKGIDRMEGDHSLLTVLHEASPGAACDICTAATGTVLILRRGTDEVVLPIVQELNGCVRSGSSTTSK